MTARARATVVAGTGLASALHDRGGFPVSQPRKWCVIMEAAGCRCGEVGAPGRV